MKENSESPQVLSLLESTRQRAHQAMVHSEELQNSLAKTIQLIANSEDLITRSDVLILVLRETVLGSCDQHSAPPPPRSDCET